jgi:hypothetical protein
MEIVCEWRHRRTGEYKLATAVFIQHELVRRNRFQAHGQRLLAGPDSHALKSKRATACVQSTCVETGLMGFKRANNGYPLGRISGRETLDERLLSSIHTSRLRWHALSNQQPTAMHAFAKHAV